MLIHDIKTTLKWIPSCESAASSYRALIGPEDLLAQERFMVADKNALHLTSADRDDISQRKALIVWETQ